MKISKIEMILELHTPFNEILKMNIFTSKRQNLKIILSALLKNLKIKVNSASADICLSDHPAYPSVLALSDCLWDWDVDNSTYKIDKTDYDKKDMLFPFAAHFNEKGGKFILVYRIENDKVYYADEENEKGVISENDFLDRWDGIALHAKKKLTSGEKKYYLKYSSFFLQRILIPVLPIFCFVLFCFTITTYPYLYILITLIKFAGTGITILLLAQSLNSQNPFIKNLCGSNGKNECNSILNSDASQITEWLSWSELGFFYFAGSLFLLLFQPAAMPLLARLNLFALPYTIYSITYQLKNKTWCTLCCLVQGLLWVEFIINIIFNSFNHISAAISLPYTLIIFVIPTIAWFLLKPLIYLSLQVPPLKQQLKNFKFNYELFVHSLVSQPRYEVDNSLMPVNLGDPSAPITIVMVSNPYCNPCAKAHQVLDALMASRKDIQVKVLFATYGNENDLRTKVAGHFLALTRDQDKTLAADALKYWYKKKDKYEIWAQKYPVTKNDEDERAVIQQRTWCTMAEITFTPTILINGYKIPKGYHLEDLKYLL